MVSTNIYIDIFGRMAAVAPGRWLQSLVCFFMVFVFFILKI